MRAEYINPFLTSTSSVFSQMLGVEVQRQAPFLRSAHSPQYDVSGVIGLTGRTTGTVALSLSRETALEVTSRLLGEPIQELNASVVDAVGELTNMLAGAAKAQLESLQLSLGLPTVIIGKSTTIGFPSDAVPISIPFDSSIGAFVVEVGMRA